MQTQRTTTPPRSTAARDHEIWIGVGENDPVSQSQNVAAPAQWVSLAEAAAVVGISSNTVRRAVKAGTIRGHRAGEAQNSPWLVHLDDVEARWGDKASAPEAEAGARAIKSENGEDAEPEGISTLRERLVISEPERRWWRPSR